MFALLADHARQRAAVSDQEVEKAIAQVFLAHDPAERNRKQICLPFVHTVQSLETMGLVAMRVKRRLCDGVPSWPVLLSGDTGTGEFYRTPPFGSVGLSPE